MDETLNRPVFDTAERHAVRTALKRYMAEQRIGTPTLQVRIIEADRPRHREIPLSTLQRFLTGSHRTENHHVALCHAFASALPYYGQDREFCELGDALLAFLGTQNQLAGQAKLFPPDYRSEFEFREYPWDTRYADEPLIYPPLGTEYGTISLSAVPETNFLRVNQLFRDNVITGPDSTSGGFLKTRKDGKRAFEGIMIVVEPHIYIFLRCKLTRVPRIFYLAEDDYSSAQKRILVGKSFERLFMAEKSESVLSRTWAVFLAENEKESA